MTITTTAPTPNKRAKSLDAERIHQFYVVGFDRVKRQIVEVIDARCYKSRHTSDGPVTACVWIKSDDEFFRTGMAVAGGNFYHKACEAITQAVFHAGLRFSDQFDGSNDKPIKDILFEAAKHFHPHLTGLRVIGS